MPNYLMKKKPKASWFAGASVGVVALMLSTAVHAASFSFEAIAVTGDVAPGTGGSAQLFNFRDPSLNNQGETAFFGNLTGSNVNEQNNTGIFSNSNGVLTFVTREGDPIPGTAAGTTAGAFGNPSINDQGETAFSAFLGGPSVTGSTSSAIFSEAGGGLSLVAQGGDPAPGAGAGATFTFFGNPVINDQGDTAFRVPVAGSSTTNGGIFKEAGDGLSLAVGHGDVAPGAGAGVTFSFIVGSPDLNDQGDTAFRGFLTGQGVTLSNDTGVFRELGGGLTLVAREGDVVPGAASGTTFGTFLDPSINNRGETAFFGFINGPGGVDRGIFSEAGGGLSLVARQGEAAPDTDAGVTFFQFGDLNLNDQGETAFLGGLTGTGVTGANDFGIFSETSGALSLIVREGDILDIGGGNLRTIDTLRFGGGFNDAGQVAFLASFSGGGQGIFVATPDSAVSAVPLPAGLPLVVSGLFGLALIGRRRKRDLAS